MEDTPTKTIDFAIYPEKMTRKILVFLADVALALIASILLFELVTLPITKLSGVYNQIVDQSNDYTAKRTEILYDNEILFYDDASKDKLTDSISYSSEKFISFYTIGDSSKNDVIYEYFVNIKGQNVSYVNEIYYKEAPAYFDNTKTTELGTYAFKDSVKEMFLPAFTEGDEMNTTGKNSYNSFKESIFLSMYSYVLSDIKTNDLSSTKLSNSFLEYTALINEQDNRLNNTYVLNVYACFFVSCLALFFIVPLCNQKGRTIGEMILKVEHVTFNKLKYLKKGKICIMGLFNSTHILGVLIFIPLISVGFNTILNISAFVIPWLMGVAIWIIELIFSLITKMNQSLKEITTQSILVSTELVDEYYRVMEENKWKMKSTK
jgi:hypothetical protein